MKRHLSEAKSVNYLGNAGLSYMWLRVWANPNARWVFMSSRVFDASEAETFGIITKAVALEKLDAAIEAEVTPYLNCAPSIRSRRSQGIGPEAWPHNRRRHCDSIH